MKKILLGLMAAFIATAAFAESNFMEKDGKVYLTDDAKDKIKNYELWNGESIVRWDLNEQIHRENLMWFLSIKFDDRVKDDPAFMKDIISNLFKLTVEFGEKEFGKKEDAFWVEKVAALINIFASNDVRFKTWEDDLDNKNLKTSLNTAFEKIKNLLELDSATANQLSRAVMKVGMENWQKNQQKRKEFERFNRELFAQPQPQGLFPVPQPPVDEAADAAALEAAKIKAAQEENDRLVNAEKAKQQALNAQPKEGSVGATKVTQGNETEKVKTAEEKEKLLQRERAPRKGRTSRSAAPPALQ